MVTKPDQPVPSSAEGLKKMPKIEPMELATSASYSPKYQSDPATSAARQDVANSDKTGENKFKLPEKVSQADIRDQSFRYGGGRSAGNRSLQANKDRKTDEQ
jgi:hypothetical protein